MFVKKKGRTEETTWSWSLNDTCDFQSVCNSNSIFQYSCIARISSIDRVGDVLTPQESLPDWVTKLAVPALVIQAMKGAGFHPFVSRLDKSSFFSWLLVKQLAPLPQIGRYFTSYYTSSTFFCAVMIVLFVWWKKWLFNIHLMYCHSKASKHITQSPKISGFSCSISLLLPSCVLI